MKKHKVLDVQVYDYESDNEPLIFLHSFPLNSGMWNEQVEYFKTNYRVITYDIRGFGESDNGDYLISMEKLVNDFFHIINKLKLKKVNACGISMGGYILLRAIEKDYKRFSSVTLVNTNASKDDDDIILKRTSAIIKIKSGGRNTYLKKLIPLLTNNIDNINKINNIISKNSDNGICAGLMALSTRINTLEKINFYDIPVLFLESDDDKINRNKITELFNTVCSASESHENTLCKITIPDSGHLVNIDNPGLFNKYLEWFLSFK